MSTSTSDWDDLFSKPTSKPTGATAPKVINATPTPATPPPAPKTQPKAEPVADTNEAEFDIGDFFTDESGDADDQAGSAATVTQAKETLAAVITGVEPTKVSATEAEPEKKRRGRGPAKKHVPTGAEFAEAMAKTEGGSKEAEILFPETVAEVVSTPNAVGKEITSGQSESLKSAVEIIIRAIVNKLIL